MLRLDFLYHIIMPLVTFNARMDCNFSHELLMSTGHDR